MNIVKRLRQDGGFIEEKIRWKIKVVALAMKGYIAEKEKKKVKRKLRSQFIFQGI